MTIENCVACVGHQALDLEKKIRCIEKSLNNNEVTDIFKDLIEPIEHEFSPLETTWGLAKTIYLGNSTLMPTKSYLSIHDRARKASAMKFNSMPIFTAVTKAIESKSESLTDEQVRVLEKYALEIKLNGINLSTTDRYLMIETLGKMNTLKVKFGERVDSIVKNFKHYIHDANLMQEFPPHLLQAMANDPTKPTKGPWKVTLQPYIYKSFLEYCPNHDMRWNVWQADTRKASGYTDKSLNNSTALEEIRSFRQDQAKLLGKLY